LNDYNIGIKENDMKKNLITVLCLLTFAGSAFAEMYQIPGSYKETVTEVTTQPEGTTAQLEPTTKKEKGRFRMFWRKRKDYNPTNTYWNFGRPNFWTGSI